MLIKRSIAVALSIVYLFNAGCATIFKGSRDTISVRSEEDGTKLYIDEQYIGKNSAVHQVPKKGDHVIRASKEGCTDVTIPIPYSFDGVTLLGLLIDLGLISILVVDGLATGATSSASQTNFVLTPDCKKQPKAALDDAIFKSKLHAI